MLLPMLLPMLLLMFKRFILVLRRNLPRPHRQVACENFQGTAESAAFEMYLLYKLPVAVVPTNRPRLRVDKPLEVYWTQEDKFQVREGLSRAAQRRSFLFSNHLPKLRVLEWSRTIELAAAPPLRAEAAHPSCGMLQKKAAGPYWHGEHRREPGGCRISPQPSPSAELPAVECPPRPPPAGLQCLVLADAMRCSAGPY
jgi:hypothetical protein